MPRIAAIVLQHGMWQKTAACINSLLQSTLAPEWIIAVDNASRDNSAQMLANWLEGKNSFALHSEAAANTQPGRLNLLKLSQNGGYAQGNNAGIALGMAWGADAFLIINNDANVAPEALAAMWRRLSNAKKPGICGPLLIYARPGNPVQCCGGGHTNYLTGLSRFIGSEMPLEKAQGMRPEAIEEQLNFICGACALVSRAFIEQVGPMDKGFFLYCEEQDWAIRAKNAFDLVYAPDALVYHDEGATTGWSHYSFSWKPGWRLFRSRIRLAWLHHPWFVPTVTVGCVFAGFRFLLKKATNSLGKNNKNGPQESSTH